MQFKWDEARVWVTDDNGNKCSVAHFGSEAAAEKALRSLIDCRNCVNCSRCYGCSDCYDCYDCSRCHDCSDCYDCSRCYGCSDCYGCYDCSDCSDCHDCSYCSDCYDCSRCYDEKGREGAGFGPVPRLDSIHQQVYAAASQEGALDMGLWHADGHCGTTHCRAGWVTHLAGKAGRLLEKQTSTLFAAQQIYKASGSPINPSRFFDTDELALADMKRLAEAEAAAK